MNVETSVVGGEDTPLKREHVNSNVKLFIYLNSLSKFTRRNLVFFHYPNSFDFLMNWDEID
jgi:hypothetical protein